MLKNDGKLAFTKQSKSDEHMKHGLHFQKSGGGGWGAAPLFANKIIYITPGGLDGLTKQRGRGSVGIVERNEMI